jgi:hypothetical protein
VEVAAGIVVDLATLEHVPDGGEDGVGDGDGGAVRAPAGLEAMVLRCEIGLACRAAARAASISAERSYFEPFVVRPERRLPGGLVVAGADAGRAGNLFRGREGGHVAAGLDD